MNSGLTVCITMSVKCGMNDNTNTIVMINNMNVTCFVRRLGATDVSPLEDSSPDLFPFLMGVRGKGDLDLVSRIFTFLTSSP